MEKFAFLKATRFIVSIIGALSIYLEAKGIIGEPEMVLVATVSAIFIGVRSLDRFSEKLN